MVGVLPVMCAGCPQTPRVLKTVPPMYLCAAASSTESPDGALFLLLLRPAPRSRSPRRIPPAADPTTLLMNVPFTGVQFAVYESAKRALVASNVLSSPEEEGLLEQLVAGGAAGGLAAAVTNPLVRSERGQPGKACQPGPFVWGGVIWK